MESAKTYVPKYCEIEAVQLRKRFDWPDWFHEAVTTRKITTFGLGKFADGKVYCLISTPEGIMNAKDGDYIIQGLEGEIYPCKESVFKKKYILKGDLNYAVNSCRD